MITCAVATVSLNVFSPEKQEKFRNRKRDGEPDDNGNDDNDNSDTGNNRRGVRRKRKCKLEGAQEQEAYGGG